MNGYARSLGAPPCRGFCVASMRVRVRGAACTYSSPAICSSESRAQETNATVRVSSLWSGATPSATARAPLLHAPPPSNADISYPAILAEWCTYLLNSLYVCFLGSDCRLYRISGYCRTVSRFVPYLFPVGLRRHRLLDPYIVVLQQRRVPPHRMGE